MWDFGDDEVAFMFLAFGLTLFLGYRFLTQLLIVPRMVSRTAPRILLLLLLPACAEIIWAVLNNWSDPNDVRRHIDYMMLFMLGGIPWILSPIIYAPIFGVSLREDVVERNNSAAAITLAGLMIGNTLCYAGANIGSGPTIWTTIVPALTAAAGLFLATLIIELITGFSELIAIGRDVKSSAILAGFSIIAGAILAWAASGDWHDWPGTFRDFGVRGWPVLVLAIIATILLQSQAPMKLPEARQ